MTQVVVAKQDIPQRTVIKENMLKVVDMPQDAVPDGAMRSVSEVVDKLANVPIQQGDILTDKKVITDPKLAGFVGMIPPDCRAISVGISDITGIAGFAKPGDYVDVMIIRKNKGQGNVSGALLLQNVQRCQCIQRCHGYGDVGTDLRGSAEAGCRGADGYDISGPASGYTK